jgi:hypothetical protein
MDKQLDPQLSRLFSNYAPAFEATAFIAQVNSALDRAERHSRWRSASGWAAIALIVGSVAVFASGPLGQLLAFTDSKALSAGLSLVSLSPISMTPLNVTLLTAVVGLLLHRRIRAMFAL